jgi:DNA-binding FadR family transcriptional regulator
MGFTGDVKAIQEEDKAALVRWFGDSAGEDGRGWTMNATIPTTIRELLTHPDWEGFIVDRLGSDLFINDPDRATRIHDAAEDGCDGSTHAEVIEDWMDFAKQIEQQAMREAWNESEEEEARVAAEFAKLYAEIEACERRHADAGTLHEEIG